MTIIFLIFGGFQINYGYKIQIRDVLTYHTTFLLEQESLKLDPYEVFNTDKKFKLSESKRILYTDKYNFFLQNHKPINELVFYGYLGYEDKKIYQYYLHYTPIVFAILYSINLVFANKLRIIVLDTYLLESSYEFIAIKMFILFIEKLEIDKNNRNRFFKKRCVKE